MPITSKQATRLIKRLPVNRSVSTVARSSSRISRIASAIVKSPPVPAGVALFEKENNVGANYDTDWARSYPARIARVLILNGLMKPVVDLLATPTVHGTDRLNDLDGPVIFAANHHSHVDTPLMMTAIPEPWRNRLFIGAAADYWFTNRITSPLSALAIGAIPVERTKVSRKAIDQSLELLKENWSMLIFPEGARSPDGWARPFTSGAAFLSSHSGVPVVPVYLHGTNKVLPKGKNFPRPARTSVIFGSPMQSADGEDSRAFSARIQSAVAALGDESATNWWQAQKNAAAASTPTLDGPDTGAWRRSWARTSKVKGPRRNWPKV
ncbi:MAG: lysophospholipid acyltransferase family protein [Acidimicrobiales bacterium]